MIETEHSGDSSAVITVRSKRQAMDWSLALASQGVAATIHRAETGWVLLVDPPEYEQARDILRQYEIENRGWKWRQHLPGTGFTLHWGALLWALVLTALYYGSAVRFPRLESAGIVDSRAVEHGQWWRLFTAVTLHENLPHLAANAATGFVLLGLAMARFGPGIALLTTFLAGAAANYAAVVLDPSVHESLGASGMVTAALGMVTVQTFGPARGQRIAMRLLMRAAAAGVLILVLIGFSQGSDIVAHIGGFVGGAILGLALARVRPDKLHSSATNWLCGLALTVLVLATWFLAARANVGREGQ
jgi:rhomboid protease GluP